MAMPGGQPPSMDDMMPARGDMEPDMPPPARGGNMMSSDMELLGPDDEDRMIVSLLSEKQLARLMEQTVIARNATAETRARFEQVQELLRKGKQKSAIADVLQSQTIRLFKDQLVKATRREAELLTKYGPKHPELIKARAETADVDAQLARAIEPAGSEPPAG